jgi:hypothetical protein
MRTKGPGAKNADAHPNEGASDPRLRWYPPSWRDRYGDELIAVLDDEYEGHLPTRVHFDLVAGGLRQRARQSGLTGDLVPAARGVRSGALMVFSAWVAFVIAGASFAKFSEHFDQAFPHSMSAHRLSDLAVTVLQIVGGVACLLVVVGALLAVPAFVRYLGAGGWPSVRGHILRALACTGLTVVVTVPLLVWAHHLTSHQRNGGLYWYGALFLLWAALIVLTLASWAVVAIVAGSRAPFSRAILTAEAILAVLIAIAMVVMAGAIAVWWGAMAKDAPAFLNASPGGLPSSPWDVWLVATVALMVVATGTAAMGVVREAREWRRMQAG